MVLCESDRRGRCRCDECDDRGTSHSWTPRLSVAGWLPMGRSGLFPVVLARISFAGACSGPSANSVEILGRTGGNLWLFMPVETFQGIFKTSGKTRGAWVKNCEINLEIFSIA